MSAIHWILSVLVPLLGGGTEATPSAGSSLNSSVNGKVVVYPPGRKFSLDLDVPASAGYQWDYQLSDGDVVSSESRPDYRPKYGDAVVPGGLTVETFHFVTKSPGRCVIRLSQRQPWMTDVPPRDTLEFTVVVKP